jgi:hypothetical protein
MLACSQLIDFRIFKLADFEKIRATALCAYVNGEMCLHQCNYISIHFRENGGSAVVTHALSPGDTAETNMAASWITSAPHSLRTLPGLVDLAVFRRLDLCASLGENTMPHLHPFTWRRKQHSLCSTWDWRRLETQGYLPNAILLLETLQVFAAGKYSYCSLVTGHRRFGLSPSSV